VRAARCDGGEEEAIATPNSRASADSGDYRKRHESGLVRYDCNHVDLNQPLGARESATTMPVDTG